MLVDIYSKDFVESWEWLGFTSGSLQSTLCVCDDLSCDVEFILWGVMRRTFQILDDTMWLQVCYQRKVPSHFDDMNKIRLDNLDVWDTFRVQVMKHTSTDFNKVIFNASHLNWFLLHLVETLQILLLFCSKLLK